MWYAGVCPQGDNIENAYLKSNFADSETSPAVTRNQIA
jgi:hypothetical protein